MSKELLRTRIGNTVTVVLPVLTRGDAVSLVGRDITIMLVDPNDTKTPVSFTIGGVDNNIATFVVEGTSQSATGTYRAEVYENYRGTAMAVYDCDIFVLVARTEYENDGNEGVSSETTTLDPINIAWVGRDGYTPYIQDGYWYINGTSTNVKAAGENGDTPYIENGYWYIGGISTGIKVDYTNEEAQRAASEQVRVVAEAARVQAEAARTLAENSRLTEESGRSQAEGVRILAERDRQAGEAMRQTNEEIRTDNEEARVEAELGRAASETSRAQVEATRVANETARTTAEATRAANEQTRVAEETDRAAAETARIANETARETAEDGRASAEATRVSNEQTRVSNESTRQSNESARQAAETARQSAYTAAENARDAAFAAKEATRDAANQAALDCADTLAALGPKLDKAPTISDYSAERDFDISDEDGNAIVLFKNGHIKTLNFDSEELDETITQMQQDINNPDVSVDSIENEPDFEISDEEGNAIVRFTNGGIKTKNFDSENLKIPTQSGTITITKKDSNTIETSGIDEPFIIEVTDDYRIYSATLYAADGTEENENFLAPDDTHNFAYRAWTLRKFYGTYNVRKGSYIKVQIRKADGGSVANVRLGGVVKRFGLLNHQPFVSTLEAMPLGYKVAAKKIRQMMSVVWTPVAKVPSDDDHIGAETSKYFLANKRQTALPYSSVKECFKYVGWAVSFYTFLTAIKNKKSLFYTENVESTRSKSSYGYTYHGVNCSCYFGAVCNTLVNKAIGNTYLYDSNDIMSISGMSPLSNPTIDDLQPLDLIWYSGHISLVYDIIKDELGKVLFVVWAEMNIPTGRLSPYTPELLWERVARKTASFYRYSHIGEDTNINEEDIVPTEDFMYSYNTNELLNICTFMGDKAVFVTGDDIYLNIIKGNNTAVRIYNGSTLVQTIDISSMNTSSDGYIVVDSKPGINVTSYCQDGGNYKAVLFDGNNEGDFTQFSVYPITLALSGISGNATLTFTVPSGCVPVALELVQENGGDVNHLIFNSSDISNGYVNVTWNFNSSRYARIWVRVPSGEIAVKRILFNS